MPNNQQPSQYRNTGAGRSPGRLLACALLLAGTAVHADSIRIGTRLIVDGDTQQMVLAVAGRPDAIAHVKAHRRGESPGEIWTYHRDGHHLCITLRDGVVTAIASQRDK